MMVENGLDLKSSWSVYWQWESEASAQIRPRALLRALEAWQEHRETVVMDQGWGDECGVYVAD
jgi:hypothetical protein